MQQLISKQSQTILEKAHKEIEEKEDTKLCIRVFNFDEKLICSIGDFKDRPMIIQVFNMIAPYSELGGYYKNSVDLRKKICILWALHYYAKITSIVVKQECMLFSGECCICKKIAHREIKLDELEYDENDVNAVCANLVCRNKFSKIKNI